MTADATYGGTLMDIDDVLTQFRSTGHATVNFDRAHCRRDILLALLALAFLIAMAAWCGYRLWQPADGTVWVIVVGLLIEMLFLLPIGVVTWTLILLVKRASSTRPAPGLVLSPEGVAVATVLVPLKAPVPWAEVTDINLRQANPGKIVVAIATAGRTVFVPRFLEYDPSRLHYLLENARATPRI